MRLRDGVVILEPGDTSSLSKVRTLLTGAARTLGAEHESTKELMRLADSVAHVEDGKMPGIALPRKRPKKDDSAPLFDGNGHAEEPPGLPDPQCPDCGTGLTPGEVRRGKGCFRCMPIKEGSAPCSK